MYGYSIRDLTIFLGTLIFLLAAFYFIKKIIIKRLRNIVIKTDSKIDDLVLDIFEDKGLPLLFVCAVYIFVRQQSFSEKFMIYIDKTLMFLFVFYITSSLIKVIQVVILQKMQEEKNKGQAKNSSAIISIVKMVFWVLALLFTLDNLGLKISSIIAGLGIGGIAIALASQAFLGDLFNYFAIVFDKPFEEGDFIILDQVMGTIERIGLKTTRIRSLEGEQIVISNTQLTNSKIHNYKKMQERRVLFNIGVPYDTSLEKLKIITQNIERAIKDIPETRFDRAHLKNFGDFSLIFEFVYYVLNSDYNKYMDVQQIINYEIIKMFTKENIIFAYPTQIVKVAS